MVRIRHVFLALLLLAGSISIYAQNDQLTQRNGLLKATLTISPGFLLKTPASLIYLHGHLEYFPEEKVSLRGDTFLGLSSSQSGDLKTNHTVQFGALYHFIQGKFDPYIGFQPGINISNINLPSSASNSTVVTPMFSLNTGANFFVSKYFHFFLMAGYYNGAILKMAQTDSSPSSATIPINIPLDEIRISGGLGFNINVKRAN